MEVRDQLNAMIVYSHTRSTQSEYRARINMVSKEKYPMHGGNQKPDLSPHGHSLDCVSKKGFFSLSHLHNCVDTHVTLGRVKMPKMYLGNNIAVRWKATSAFMILSQLSHFNPKCI
jgi:hypothetical protein